MERKVIMDVITAIVALMSATVVAKLTISPWFPIVGVIFVGYLLFVTIVSAYAYSK